ncbi:unnamed protein product, partial [Ectocarpus sp. 12 AP-2014]
QGSQLLRYRSCREPAFVERHLSPHLHSSCVACVAKVLRRPMRKDKAIQNLSGMMEILMWPVDMRLPQVPHAGRWSTCALRNITLSSSSKRIANSCVPLYVL